MKALTFIIFSLFISLSLSSEIKNIRSKFKKGIIHSHTIGGYVSQYFAETPTTWVTADNAPFKYQIHFKHLRSKYHRMVMNIVDHYPVSGWPLIVRYLVMPQVYGYYSVSVLDDYLGTLYNHLQSVYPTILKAELSSAVRETDPQTKMNNLIEQIANLEEDKKTADNDLLILAEILEVAKNTKKHVSKVL